MKKCGKGTEKGGFKFKELMTTLTRGLLTRNGVLLSMSHTYN